MDVAAIAAMAVASNAAATRAAMGTAMTKMAAEADRAVVSMIDEVLRAAPEPGTGTRLDVTA